MLWLLLFIVLVTQNIGKAVCNVNRNWDLFLWLWQRKYLLSAICNFRDICNNFLRSIWVCVKNIKVCALYEQYLSNRVWAGYVQDVIHQAAVILAIHSQHWVNKYPSVTTGYYSGPYEGVFTLKMASWAVGSDNVGADTVGARWGSWVWWVSAVVVLYSQKPEAVVQCEQKQDL